MALNRSALQEDESKLSAFVAALRRVAAASTLSIGELRALEQRRQRLVVDLRQAGQLLYFAATQGRAVDDALAKPILEAASAAAAESVSEAQEQAFLVAYRRLAMEMAPVTAATLESSRQRLPRLADLWTRRRFVDDLSRITLGRFVHFTSFTLVLLCAGGTIAYQTAGDAALAGCKDAGKRYEKLQLEWPRTMATQRERQRKLYALTERQDARLDDKALADIKLQEAMADVRRAEQQDRETLAERAKLALMMKAWTDQPCRSDLLNWICRFALNGGTPVGDSEMVFDAEMALKRLNTIVLPMLLGLLGAYAYVLRSVSREIRERSFSAHSALHHLVRLSLGALAGIAVGWVLKPEQIGLLSSVPAWVTAFVAGYGIELLFAFLDRIVAAFTSRQSAAAR